MTVKELLINSAKYLKTKNIEDPSKEAGLLLSWFLKKDLSFIYAHGDLPIEGSKTKSYWELIERRGKDEPFAYITGECEFMSLTFKVNPHVLIPRADTEVLAEAAIGAFGEKGFLDCLHNITYKLPAKDHYTGLDIGTGSGCLAISIAKYVPNIAMTAVDISDMALKTARRNAVRNHVQDRVIFVEADFLSDNFLDSLNSSFIDFQGGSYSDSLGNSLDGLLTDSMTQSLGTSLDATLKGCEIEQKYDLIVSNPPYIPDNDIATLMASVQDYEPHSALKGGDDGLTFYRALAKKASTLLNAQGIMAVECGYGQAIDIQHIFGQYNLNSIILKDLSGIDRVVVAWYKV